MAQEPQKSFPRFSLVMKKLTENRSAGQGSGDVDDDGMEWMDSAGQCLLRSAEWLVPRMFAWRAGC